MRMKILVGYDDHDEDNEWLHAQKLEITRALLQRKRMLASKTNYSVFDLVFVPVRLAGYVTIASVAAKTIDTTPHMSINIP